MGRARVWVDEVSFDIVPEEQVTAVRNMIARNYARTDATLTAFRFSGPEAVATARKATQQGGFTLVELSRDTWTRGEDGWKLIGARAALARIRSAGADPETVRAVTEDIRQFASSADRAGTVSLVGRVRGDHRADLPEGSGEHVLAAAGIAQWVLDLRNVPAGSALGRWLAEPHLFHGQPGTLAKTCDALVFLEAGGPRAGALQ